MSKSMSKKYQALNRRDVEESRKQNEEEDRETKLLQKDNIKDVSKGIDKLIKESQDLDKKSKLRLELRALFISGKIDKDTQLDYNDLIDELKFDEVERFIKKHSKSSKGHHSESDEEEIKPRHKKIVMREEEVLEKYTPVPKKRGRPATKEKVVKEKLKPVSLKTIGHELNSRTRKEKLTPEKKREIYDFIMKFD